VKNYVAFTIMVAQSFSCLAPGSTKMRDPRNEVASSEAYEPISKPKFMLSLKTGLLLVKLIMNATLQN